jgi:hypothetical protein
MTGYVRQDTTNNIADGNVINAADFDNEYNAIQAAFNKTTGHAHDGTDAEGAPITKVGPSQDVVVSSSTVTPKTDNTIDLGTSLLKFKNIHLSGTINGTTIPSSVTLVSTAATQTLTNKTIAFSSNTLTDVAGTTATQTLTNKTVVAPVVLASATTTQDGVIVTGRAGGSTSLRVTVAPTTLTASRAQTLPDAAGTFVLDAATQTLTNKTLTAPTMTGAILNDGYTEEVFAVTGTTPALSPTNGSIQTWTLSGNSTPTAGTWAAGQSITLMVDDGLAFTITWTSLPVTWKTDSGVPPTLNTTGITAIQLWKVGTTIYGARVGNA